MSFRQQSPDGWQKGRLKGFGWLLGGVWLDWGLFSGNGAIKERLFAFTRDSGRVVADEWMDGCFAASSTYERQAIYGSKSPLHSIRRKYDPNKFPSLRSQQGWLQLG